MLAPLLFTCTHQTSSRAPAAPHPQRHGGHRHHGPSRSGVVVQNGTATLTPCKPSELAGKAAAASGLAHVHVHTQMLRIFYLCQVSDLQKKCSSWKALVHIKEATSGLRAHPQGPECSRTVPGRPARCRVRPPHLCCQVKGWSSPRSLVLVSDLHPHQLGCCAAWRP